ncbi:prenyltransferase/squalene oxidase repeat-containing protein [Aeoliella sp. SH292]|uniref:prenyltransferase/squalene oxidase repeat-containing protein n=1 Tax=Aeoliella sp. SH292 TaxID=3454464 RepID=UPI003F9E8BEF
MQTAEFELDLLPPTVAPRATGQGGVRDPGNNEPPPSTPAPLVDITGMLRGSPPWLVSAMIHMVALIVLGLLMTVTAVDVPFILNARYAEELGEIDLDAIDDLNVPQDIQIEQTELASDDLPVVLDPMSMPDMVPIQPEGLAMASNMPSISVGVALSGRTPGMRNALRDAYGGNATTESAVMQGLAWLERNQQRNGSWSLRGPYQDGSSRENAEAATAMALLAFQGHGYTHKPLPNDEFPRVVSRGWNWLLAQQYDDGHFFQDDVGDARLYTHAQCTIAICELYAMTQDPELRKPAQKAVDYCVKIQTSAGGWRYDPGQGEDLSVTGWFAMALQSARMAGLEVPSDSFKRLSEYLDSVEKEYGSRYSYQPRQGATPAMTAEGLLCRQYLGWERDDQRLQEGVAWLLNFLPEWDERNVYQWYYTTQVMHHMEGSAWQKWNSVMRQLLPDRQEKRGRERGSWDPNGDRWGSQGGRLYTTCLSIYMLEVYYRHLPIYGRLAVEQ